MRAEKRRTCVTASFDEVGWLQKRGFSEGGLEETNVEKKGVAW